MTESLRTLLFDELESELVAERFFGVLDNLILHRATNNEDDLVDSSFCEAGENMAEDGTPRQTNHRLRLRMGLWV
ncbi:hypothetical protein GCM10009019_20240 [Salarchaeum japonicum]|uniref:Transposase n=1 Tax=Salarchaeum japonicum TaxID=555573 RepID=A0AAV3T4Y1_9EURY